MSSSQKDELFQRLKASNRLPSPPGVALRVLELARSDDASLEDLEKTIKSDPALSIKILKFVNSPAAGLGRSTSSLEDAVNHIGLRGIQLMALSFSLISAPKGVSSSSFQFDRFWSRSLAAAVAAKIFARTAGRLDPNEAFISGLLLHIGQLAITSVMPDVYEEVLKAAAEQPQSLRQLEQDKLGASHMEASAWLLQQWRLPESIWQTIAEVSAITSTGTCDPNRVTASHVLYLADVTSLLLSDSKAERVGKAAEILKQVRNTFDLDDAAWKSLYDQIVVEWKAYGQLLSVKAGTDKSFAELQMEAQEQITVITIATQLENVGMKEQNQQLLQRSRIDALTGIANRASFDERLNSELERATRTQRPLVLCMIDVDHFKKFNDTYGHLTGDQVLKSVAGVLRDSVRKMDFAARYGGEEFAVIAPECTAQSAEILAERLRTAIASSKLNFEGKPLQVTISLGLACAQWPVNPKAPSDLIRDADTQLYEAKKAGRNRFRIASSLRQAA